jgi:hypothetical protein
MRFAYHPANQKLSKCNIMTIKVNRYHPQIVFHPGVTLAETFLVKHSEKL